MYKKPNTRFYSQLFFLLISILLVIILQSSILKYAHTYCPNACVCFGTLNLLNGTNLFIPAIITGIAILLFTIFFGRKFCGYVCPFGTIQELLFPKYRLKKKKDIPYMLHNKMKYVKYIIFFTTVFFLVLGVPYYFMAFCPVLLLAHPSTILFASIALWVIFIILMFLVERFGCRYLCPYAALLNISQVIGSLFKIKRSHIFRNMEVCIDCGLCSKKCPMAINLLNYEDVTDPECIHCLRCIEGCPKKGALKF